MAQSQMGTQYGLFRLVRSVHIGIAASVSEIMSGALLLNLSRAY